MRFALIIIKRNLFFFLLIIVIPACVNTKQSTKISLPLAVLKARVLVDKNYVNMCGTKFSAQDEWKRTARKRIMVLSEYFEKEFAIKLEILSIDFWGHGYKVSKYLPYLERMPRLLLFSNLLNQPLSGADILIGISGSDFGGMTESNGNYMLVSTPKQYRQKRGGHGFRGRYNYADNTKYLDRHELGHIFGLHDEDYGHGSIMKPDARVTEFNTLEKSIIMKNKKEKFK